MNIQHSLWGFIFFMVLLCGCDKTPVCRTLTGKWTDGEGQDLVFMNDGAALWLTRFGSSTDTIRFAYQLVCKDAPALCDWSQFSGGPYSGKTLYGIMEWLSDTSFRFRFEPGYQSGVRPIEFDQEQTLRFQRSK